MNVFFGQGIPKLWSFLEHLCRRPTMNIVSLAVATPATCIAAYSPRLWPITISGLTPREAQYLAKAISVQTRASWVTTGECAWSLGCDPSRAGMKDGKPKPRARESRCWMCSRNVHTSLYNSKLIDLYEAPCPVKAKAIGGGPEFPIGLIKFIFSKRPLGFSLDFYYPTTSSCKCVGIWVLPIFSK